MAKFLFDWDDMLNNMKDGVTLDQKFLEEVMIGVIRKSEDLKIYVDYYDRQFKDSPDRNYAYLHKTIAKVVLEKRQRLNKEALLVDHSAQRRGRPQVAAVLTPDPNTSTQKGKTKGKGKGRGGGGNDSDSSGSDTPKVRLFDIKYEDCCCIRNLWLKCTEDVENGGCKFGPHVPVAPECVKTHPLYVNMIAENGTPAKPKPDKGKGKSKGKAKGKGKGKDVSPAVLGEAALEPQQQP